MEKTLFDNRIRLRHIQCFVAVAQERQLGRAAARLQLSQPAVSKTLVELEQLAGATLFERGRHGARLTARGEAFLGHALSMLESLEAARRSVAQEQEPAARALRVGALPTTAPDLLPGALHTFKQTHPGTRIVVQTAANAQLLELLQSGELDFVLGRLADPRMMVGLLFELLYLDPLILAVRPGHPLAAVAAPTLHDVVRFTLVIATSGTIPRHNAENFLNANGVRLPDNCIETLSVTLGRALTRDSDCVWLTPAGVVRQELDNEMLHRLPIATQGTEEPVGLLRRSEARLSSAAVLLMGLLREAGLRR